METSFISRVGIYRIVSGWLLINFLISGNGYKRFYSTIFNIELPSKFEANIKIVANRKLNFKYSHIFLGKRKVIHMLHKHMGLPSYNKAFSKLQTKDNNIKHLSR